MTPQRKYYLANRKKVIARSTQWQKDNPVRAREIRRASAAKYAGTLARKKARQRWIKNNRALVAAQQRRTRRKHPGTHRAAEARRRAAKYGCRCVCCTPAQLRHVYELACRAGKEVDHRKPLSLGGLHCRKNMQLLTPKQHRKKSIQDYQKWLKRRK